ncbi:MAG: hypothetical protein GYB68_19935 [Chloroflexi bacterium]|nr:hypothetical protein [Chloroflexota bacterium]
MRETGHEAIVVVGAGNGGIGVIEAGSEDANLAGIVIVSSPRSVVDAAGTIQVQLSDGTLSALTMPSLWIGARTDLLSQVEELEALATNSESELWIYEGNSMHGTFILESLDGPDMERRLLDFFGRVLSDS